MTAMTYMTTVTNPPPPANRIERHRSTVTSYIDGLWFIVVRHARTRPRRAAEAKAQAEALTELVATIDGQRTLSWGSMIWIQSLQDELATAAARPDVATHVGWATALTRIEKAIGDLVATIDQTEVTP